MNERIQQLEQQCWEVRQYNPPWFNSTKFAELIVRECIAQCNDGDSRWFIAQHFGIEE